MWKAEALKTTKNKDQSSLGTNDDNETSESPGARFKFTATARGCKRAEGWTENAFLLYNDLFDAIVAQRKLDQENKWKFDSAFLEYGEQEAFVSSSGKKAKVKLRNNWDDRALYQVSVPDSQVVRL